MSGNTVYHDGSNIALDKRSDICNELVCYICAVLVDLISGNKTLVVCDLVNVLNLCSCLIGII